MTIEQSISEIIAKKLEDGTIEKIVEEKMVKAIDSAISDAFRWGEGEKAIKNKITEVMVPAIERHDFNDYTVKLDAALTEIINNTSLVDNKHILENFKELMAEPDKKVVKLSEIWEKYKEYVAAYVDTEGLKASCDDNGEPSYECVQVSMEVEREEHKYFSSSSDDIIVVFSCEHDEREELSFTLNLWKYRNDKTTYNILNSKYGGMIDFNSLKNLTDFEIFMIKLNRACCEIEIDTKYEDDEVEPDEKPEWDLV